MRVRTTFMLGGLLAALTACTTGSRHAAADLNNEDLYEVHHEGRIHVFDSRATYRQFLEMGETSFRQTFVGAGPRGETLVFGVSGEDRQKPVDQVAGYRLYHGNLPAADNFYGEMRLAGCIYVFDRIEDMAAVRMTGKAPLRYMEAGAGPEGETLVYVLRSDNQQRKPVELMAAFWQHNRS